MRAHPRILDAFLDNVNHPVGKCVPVAPLVAPEERVFGPGGAVVGRVPGGGVDELVGAREGVCNVDF